MKLFAIKGFDEESFKKYFKNTGLMMIGKVGSLGIKMITTFMIANHLLKFNFGMISNSLNYIYIFSAIASLGLDAFIVKELHSNPKSRDSILGTSFLLKLSAGLFCIPLIYIAWQLYSLPDIPYILIFILSFTGVFQSFTIIDSYFQFKVQSKYIMQVQIFSNIISAFIKIALIYIYNAGVLAITCAYLFDTILLAIGYYYTYSKNKLNILNWKFDKKLVKKLLSNSWPLIISGIMVSIYMRIDGLMLNALLGEKGLSEAGAYNTVVTISEALNFIPVVIASTLFPAILNAKRDDPDRYKKRLQNLFDLMVWLSILFSIIISILTPFIYSFFKPEYSYAASALRIHVWGSIFVFLGVASSQLLIAEGWSKLTFLRTGTGAIINIILNFIWIPKYGIIGASLATVIAYFSSSFFLLLIPKTRSHGIMMLKSLFLISLFQKIYDRR